ncbi:MULTISPECIES: proton-conducting transporter membrane subunit [Micromonospora]|uniref:Monovalent cation/H+ antiporter subunit D family protein n=1 Tax=Micromonospora solifontis TaxID=2487138 RepID=A0ABX9WAM1_9ACTN|nr:MULTISPECIES: proton-conducting transporter membrane subunit [Micromonospora]NES12809.1 monovalent cation/H+ antiporter subunit D family protein [Micromonospora sp. PPF5-17B]NES38915.1 monovalent cation/H+ antiporter subunit D family protein [Micromonospora solifontis]NES54734.1 monovalent cation/H+ antiporter subunit D family protein [Micromonospora sp. PPF5-6]RNL92577.1 monovalent cation/H+ antiporter subunit D family protein [Micromonospora solifontis]
MTGILVVLPVVGPLLAAAALLAWPARPLLRRVTGLAVSGLVFVTAICLLAVVRSGTVLTVRIGGWAAVVAIRFAVDVFTGLMLCAVALVVLGCLASAAGTGQDRHPFFVPLALVLAAGANGALLTVDLFNLFVLIEVMLVPSYVLLALRGQARDVRAGRVYVATNLLASTLLLAGVGLLYGVHGSVQLNELVGAARESSRVAAAGGVVLVALAVKSAVVPVHAWLPRSYSEAPPVVVALFSGLLTKVGLYALIRVFAVLYGGSADHQWVIGAAALASMLVGVLGAVGEHSMRRVLSFHMVSQIGYVLLGLALFTHESLAAAIFYLVQYILVKTALFLCTAAVHADRGTDRLVALGGLAMTRPVLAAAFAGAALSLAGLPPFSGFLAKFLLIKAAAAGGAWVAVAVALGVSLLTLTSMLKVWGSVFWGLPGAARPAATGWRPQAWATLPALTLAVATLLLGLAGQQLLILSEAAATGLTNPTEYLAAVLR